MMDPLSLIGSTAAVVQYTFNTLYNFNEVAEAKNLLLSIRISLLRLQKWQSHWFKKDKYSSAIAEELWGKDGSAEIEKTIDEINKMVSVLSNTLSKDDRKVVNSKYGSDGIDLPQELENEVGKAFRDMDQRKRGHRRFVKFFKKSMVRSVQDTTRKLSAKVDQLEQLSSLSYQTLHGLRTFKNNNSYKEYVDRSILSRQGSLNLWEHCRCDTYKCSLGMDMLSDKGSVRPLHVAIRNSEDGALYWRLLWTMDGTYGFMKLADTLNFREEEADEKSEEQHLDRHIHDLKIKEPSDRNFVKMESKHCSQPSRFRIVEIDAQISSSRVARYSDKQKDQEDVNSNGIDMFSSLALKDRIKLALKISECSAQLLGTPWFALLRYTRIDHVWLPKIQSKMEDFDPNHRRIQMAASACERPHFKGILLFEQDLYTLDVPRLNIDDLVAQDPEMLAEHQQLYDLGVLLIRLALGHNIEGPTGKEDRAAWASTVLPRVNREMGNQYAEACTFCVGVRREGHWESYDSNKYSRTDDLASWKDYLERFIGDFYSEVYLK